MIVVLQVLEGAFCQCILSMARLVGIAGKSQLHAQIIHVNKKSPPVARGDGMLRFLHASHVSQTYCTWTCVVCDHRADF